MYLLNENLKIITVWKNYFIHEIGCKEKKIGQN